MKGIKLTLEIGLEGHGHPVRGDENGQPAPVLANLAPKLDIFVDRKGPALVVAAASSLEEGDLRFLLVLYASGYRILLQRWAV